MEAEIAAEVGGDQTIAVVADRGDKAHLLSATRDDYRLIGALAAEVLSGAQRHNGFPGPRKTLESDDGVDSGISNDCVGLTEDDCCASRPLADAMPGGENAPRIVDQDIVAILQLIP